MNTLFGRHPSVLLDLSRDSVMFTSQLADLAEAIESSLQESKNDEAERLQTENDNLQQIIKEMAMNQSRLLS